ncbi:predicted protein [Methanosarcina acetivorans C2A]|uniref:Uncharacterized protein n=1 Tax=Methanosarcina acetivorans (strain ATCC 35395 / DSM 2834 / JCM 12185 / C2A) TaxID=188937 RepID=Q8TTN5_METAC|nr:predicted protein [Methanosarcina acetivorans C2A]
MVNHFLSPVPLYIFPDEFHNLAAAYHFGNFTAAFFPAVLVAFIHDLHLETAVVADQDISLLHLVAANMLFQCHGFAATHQFFHIAAAFFLAALVTFLCYHDFESAVVTVKGISHFHLIALEVHMVYHIFPSPIFEKLYQSTLSIAL